MSRFHLLRGMSTMYERQQNERQEVLISKICCNTKWSVCFLDISFSNTVNEFFVLKEEKPLAVTFSNYFDLEHLSSGFSSLEMPFNSENN